MIVGLPNSGKSRLFNDLTGDYDLVANYPLTTVETKTHACTMEGESFQVMDTPGLHGLYIQSEEELVVRAEILGKTPDLLIQCVDANRFKESLHLTADLLNLGIPLALFIIAVGESVHKGLRIDAVKLADILNLPVTQSPAPGKGIAEIKQALFAPPPPAEYPHFSAAVEDAVSRVEVLLPPECTCRRESALLLLENDPTFRSAGRDGLEEELSKIRAGLAGKAPLMISAQKTRWVDDITAGVGERVKPRRPGFSETFARMCRHPLYGLPLLALFLGILYLLVVYVAGSLSLLLTLAITDPVVSAVGRLLPGGFFKDLLIGPHGLLTLGLFNSLTTVLPILSVFFLVFGLLEDVGYLPNLAILTKRVSQRIGITGNAVIPLVLGFGCKTMATMTARTLQSKKEKVIVITLIGFAIPCSAQMGLSIAILGQHGIRYFLLAFSFLALAEVIVGVVLNRLLPEDGQGQFIQELPPIRVPRFSAVARKTGYRLLWFLREAIPIFLIASLAMFAIDTLGLLGYLKQVLKPVMTGWLGLPLDMVDALLLTLARSEAAAGLVFRMAHEGTLNGVQSIVAVILLTTFAQCFANIAAMFKEVGARTAIVIVISIYLLSFLFTGAVHGLLAVTAGWLPL
jgi:ferrous iron transport protein B